MARSNFRDLASPGNIKLQFSAANQTNVSFVLSLSFEVESELLQLVLISLVLAFFMYTCGQLEAKSV